LFGINDLGQVVGRSFLATPVPEPAGLGAVAVGLIALAAARWRARSARGDRDAGIEAE
jgi:hypothetical protein